MDKISNANRETIKKIIIFHYLDNSELDEVLSISRINHYEKKEEIIHEGESSPFFFAVLKGNVNVTIREENGKDVFICTIGKGDIFGEAGIFMNVKRTANVQTSENTTLLSIHRRDILSFIKNKPAAGIKILMLIIYSLLKKLKEVNHELAFERKSDLNQDDIDSLVDSMLKEF